MTVLAANPEQGLKLRRRALTLAWITVAWNVIEAVVAIAAGSAANSTALIGFGLESTIETASAAVIIWQFSGHDQQREKRALRLIAMSFFALAVYVAGRATLGLLAGDQSEFSAVGLTLTATSLVVMPILAVAKRSVGVALGSASVAADSQQAFLCTYLSAVVVIGLGLNALFGWWWADPIAALVIAGLAVREGQSAWRGENCCD